MIPLEKQVTSLELSMQLEKLGVKQDSIFWWVKHIKSGTNRYVWDLVYGKDENDLVNKYISAFTVAEHGMALPRTIQWHNLEHTLSYSIEEYRHKGFLHRVHYKRGANGISSGGFKTEADARAKIRIHLIENKLMEAKE